MQEPSGASVEFAQEGGVARITLNRPDRMNALDREAWGLLHSAISEVKSNPDIRVVVLRGAGANFCAGADVRAASQRTEHPLQRMRTISDVVRDLFELPVPTIAAVDGVAVGAGWNLALACDFLIATDRARFSQIFARRGLSADCGGSWLLPRIVGMQKAKRLLYLAEMLSASEAYALGLVLKVCAAEAFADEVESLVGKLVVAPPAAISQDKELINATWGMSFSEQLLRENAAQAVNFATDGPIARRAIASGEQPVFEGKWQL
ncbi:hypothetical protein ASD65_13095 [Microbacterium sp. Root61]|nr:hypothetical protein ASD65_13095 [Microbacterium sp. Root61]